MESKSNNRGSLGQNLRRVVERFVDWLDRYGGLSYDHQSFYAGPIGGRAKAFYYRHPSLGLAAVAPMVLCEAFMPGARKFFWRKQRFPIADAHYAMGFALLNLSSSEKLYYDKAVHFLEVLLKTRCPDFSLCCWGYPFDWVTRNGTIPAGTPLITTTPYVYEAFSYVYQIDRGERWIGVMRSIAEHAMGDIKDFDVSPTASSCSYTPYDHGGVINAAAYRACLLTKASQDFSDHRFFERAIKNINFVLEYQRSDGSWFYSIEGERDFIDHFHTCFILKALAKIEKLTGDGRCRAAIEKGVDYYLANLFDNEGLPKPFSRAPRLTVYRRELYDYAECLNLCILLKETNRNLAEKIAVILEDLWNRWSAPDGSFRSRELLLGWDNVPMHRWAQAQLFRSLALLIYAGNIGTLPPSI
jgi:hypothetical protein